MTGLEKIIEKIESDCTASCAEILSNAQAEAQAILSSTATACEQLKRDTHASAEKKSGVEIDLAVSKAEHERKKAMLATKISIINEVIEEAMQKLKSLPDADYFEAIKTLVPHYVRAGSGVLFFSKKDLNRLPASFEGDINEALKSRGVSVSVSAEPIVIDGGFTIVYGDIEQNCSFESLLNASLDEIKDELYEAIFVRDSL